MKALIQTFLAGVAGALTVAVLMGAAGPLGLRDDGIQFPDGTVQTTADSRRAFYLTDTTSNGASALSACASGFHMASLWEIYDVSNLRYADEIADAHTSADSGEGPPNVAGGWIRTGWNSSNSSQPGVDNCNAWSTTSGEGTAVQLEFGWGFYSVANSIPPWRSDTTECVVPRFVWCVEDYPGSGS